VNETPTASENSILESNQRLSQSLLWKHQRNFFISQGIEAWNTGKVPHYATSNPLIAKAYGNVVFGFLRDCNLNTQTPLDLTQPVYIVELGSGSGRFSYHFLKQFFEDYGTSTLGEIPVKYIMTDFAQQNLDYWQSHPKLHPFVNQGLLDFAQFDIEKDSTLKLVHADEILDSSNLKNPLIVIANYFFDSIPHDLFHIDNGVLYETLITLTTPTSHPESKETTELESIQISYTDSIITADSYYDDPALNVVLKDYQNSLKSTYLLLPITALNCLSKLRQLSSDRLLFLSGDKGYSSEDSLEGRGIPNLTKHHGCFSFMVNHHAIAQYTNNQGGQALIPNHLHRSLDISAFLWYGGDCVETHHAYENTINQASPDDFFALKKALEPHFNTLSLKEILAYLRLSRWDFKIFFGCFHSLMQQVATTSEQLHQEIFTAIQNVWATYYFIGEEQDLPLHLSMVLYQMGYYSWAIEFLDHSRSLYGDDPGIYYNKAMCYHRLELPDKAAEVLDKARAIYPQFDKDFLTDSQSTEAAENILRNTTNREQQGPEQEIIQDLNGLQPLLLRLDRRIQEAQSVVQRESEAEGKAVLSWWQETGVSLEGTSIPIRSNSVIGWLEKTFDLSAFDLEILAIALAPELDRQYERIFVYLQDEISSKRPTVDLVLNLLCSNIGEKLLRRQHFTTNRPLIHHRLIHITSEPTLLRCHLNLDSQVIRLLLQPQPGLDSRLTSCSQLLESTQLSANLYLQSDIHKQLQELIYTDWQKQQPLLIYFQGSDTLGKRHTAQIIATTLEVPLLVADLAKMLDDIANFEEKLQLLWREAWFFHRLLYLENFDILYLGENKIFYSSFLKEMANNRGITILAGEKNWIPTSNGAMGVITVPFTIPESKQRKDCWRTNLQAAQIDIEDKQLDILSERFRLNPDQIADAVATAYNTTRWQSSQTKSSQNSNTQEPEKLKPSFVNLCSAARAQSGHHLATLARKIEPKYTWDDIVLHPNQLTQLQNICKEAEYRELVHQKWGFADKLSLGKGLNVLFSGSPGTGKTMAAEVIAHHLQQDLYKIDLSQIVSKYIGETEKNLNQIFTAATNSNAILLFDEADALFSKRSDVQDARDRYANMEVSYLLQKMEEYQGVAILTTNLRSNMDEAFERRLRFIIEFQFPDAKNRQGIWQKIFPKYAPCSPNINLEFLAQNFEITGANIRNIALTAAFLAADDGGVIEMDHLMQAMRREYVKMGQIFWDKDFSKY